MEFFATGEFQQLYSQLDDSTMPMVADDGDGDLYDAFPQHQHQHQQQQQQPQQLLELPSANNLECCYADVNFGNGYEPGGMDYYGIITLDSNNNHNHNQLNNCADDALLFDFSHDPDATLVSISSASASVSASASASASPPELSDWEQRLLDHFVEIPELIDILPERTPLCTDMCDSFLQESNDNLRLATPTSPAADTPSSAAAVPLQLGQNAAGEKGYLCTFGSCEKLYAKPAHLKAHLRRHLGEKPYACSWPDCSWRFSRSDELARHRRSHSGVKPYKCDYCNKCFARSDHLTKHRKVHERRLLAVTRSGKLLPNGSLPQSVYAVRPGRKRKNQL
ncbi:Krueppel-like factor luna [Drosophila albomicans]|uniref:Krueppel-like factor luna n=1 Tax=Drosophila albomicans TaxID=7291 RepID=A0A6P8XDM1_DROAB|nr:Krueppel-like factor luna [Drosophila albomicans]